MVCSENKIDAQKYHRNKYKYKPETNFEINDEANSGAGFETKAIAE